MSRSKSTSPSIGFSTGALERGDFREAVAWMVTHHIHTVELSALRFEELRPLIENLDALPLEHFNYVSVHAPSFFEREQEGEVIDLLKPVLQRHWNIIVHPDVIYTPRRWSCFGEHLLVENMDRRKPTGRTTSELEELFRQLPRARLCLDVAHARQLDTTLTLLFEIVRTLWDRVAEVHISELDSLCRHQPMSRAAVLDYRQVLGRATRDTPVIVESMLDAKRAPLRMNEIGLAKEALEATQA